jgi:transposase
MVCTSIRDRRRTLRYRHLLVRQMVQMKNRVSGLLLETGASHNKERLHQVKYFQELLTDKGHRECPPTAEIKP